MRILKEPASAEYMVKNSRFLSEAFPVATAEEARERWHAQKLKYGMSHMVYAFITGPQGNIMGCADDGEPSGTAGRPTLEVLKGSGLTNILLTTARWFGGTLLGTGGLVRAYTAGAQAVLENAVSIELVPMCITEFKVSYNIYEQTKRICLQLEMELLSEDFTDNVCMRWSMQKAAVAELEKKLKDLSSGRIQISVS